MAASFVYAVPDGDLTQYLLGTWKRCLQWRYFGPGFAHLCGSSSIVEIEEALDVTAEPGTRFINWKIGKGSEASGDKASPSPVESDDLKLALCMQVLPDANGGSHLEWVYRGQVCNGRFHAQSASATLFFRDDIGVSTVSYRAVDADTMAVCVVEMDSQHAPVLQYGTMARLTRPP